MYWYAHAHKEHQQQLRTGGVPLPPRGKSKTFEYNGQYIRKSIYYQQTRNKWVVQWGFPDGHRRTQTFNCNVLGREEALRLAEAVTPEDIPPEPNPMQTGSWIATNRKRSRDSNNIPIIYNPTNTSLSPPLSSPSPDLDPSLHFPLQAIQTLPFSNALDAEARLQQNPFMQFNFWNLQQLLQGVKTPMDSSGGFGGVGLPSLFSGAMDMSMLPPGNGGLASLSSLSSPPLSSPLPSSLPSSLSSTIPGALGGGFGVNNGGLGQFGGPMFGKKTEGDGRDMLAPIGNEFLMGFPSNFLVPEVGKTGEMGEIGEKEETAILATNGEEKSNFPPNASPAEGEEKPVSTPSVPPIISPHLSSLSSPLPLPLPLLEEGEMRKNLANKTSSSVSVFHPNNSTILPSIFMTAANLTNALQPNPSYAANFTASNFQSALNGPTNFSPAANFPASLNPGGINIPLINPSLLFGSFGGYADPATASNQLNELLQANSAAMLAANGGGMFGGGDFASLAGLSGYGEERRDGRVEEREEGRGEEREERRGRGESVGLMPMTVTTTTTSTSSSGGHSNPVTIHGTEFSVGLKEMETGERGDREEGEEREEREEGEVGEKTGEGRKDLPLGLVTSHSALPLPSSDSSYRDFVQRALTAQVLRSSEKQVGIPRTSSNLTK